MTNLQAVRKKVIKAVPGIMELKFGCNVQLKIRGDLGFIINSDFHGSVIHWNFTIKETRCLKEDDLKILGRPITLADVLLAMEKAGLEMFTTDSWNVEVSSYDVAKILRLWNLSDNNLDNQSEEVWKFLNDVL